MQSLVEDGWSSVTLQEWLAPHAQAHRIAVGRLLMGLEYKYLSGQNNLLYLGSWLSIGVLVYLCYKVARLSYPENANLSVFMVGIALIYTLSYTQTLNLIMPINTLWYISAACSAFSVYLLLFPDRNLTLSRAIGSCLLSMIAAYSVFSGLIGCLVVAVLACRCRSKHALWVPFLMLAFTLLYLSDVKSGQELVLEQMTKDDVDMTFAMHVQSLFQNRVKLFHYIVAFLSSPLSKPPSPTAYVFVVSSLSLVVFGWASLARQWYRGEAPKGEAITFYLAMATIFLGTALACFLGRGFADEPTAPRYQTVVMLYWLSISGLLLHSLPAKNDPRITVATMLLVLLIPAGLLYTQSEFKLKFVSNRSNRANDIEISTRLGFPSFHNPRVRKDKFTPEYVRFESFLSSHSLLGAVTHSESASASDAPGTCDSMRIRFQAKSVDPRQGRVVSITQAGTGLQRFRRIRMTGPEDGIGYLYALTSETASLKTLLWVNMTWKGYYRGSLDEPHVTLLFESILGPDFSCKLALST